MTISQLLWPEGTDRELSNLQLELHERAVDMFISGQWAEAEEIFGTHLAQDEPNSVLRDMIALGNKVPPNPWDGVVTLRPE